MLLLRLRFLSACVSLCEEITRLSLSQNFVILGFKMCGLGLGSDSDHRSLSECILQFHDSSPNPNPNPDPTFNLFLVMVWFKRPKFVHKLLVITCDLVR